MVASTLASTVSSVARFSGSWHAHDHMTVVLYTAQAFIRCNIARCCYNCHNCEIAMRRLPELQWSCWLKMKIVAASHGSFQTAPHPMPPAFPPPPTLHQHHAHVPVALAVTAGVSFRWPLACMCMDMYCCLQPAGACAPAFCGDGPCLASVVEAIRDAWLQRGRHGGRPGWSSPPNVRAGRLAVSWCRCRCAPQCLSAM